MLLATACGGPDAGPDPTLTAAGAAGAEPAPTVTAPAPSTTLPPTTAAPPTTARLASTAATATTAAPRPRPTAAPAPATTAVAAPGPTVAPETVSSVTTTVTQGSTVANMRAVREQYLGEKVYVWAEATSAERITSIQVDFGDGSVTTDPQTLPSTLFTVGAMSASTTRVHVYPVPGRYRITVTFTVVPGFATPRLPPSPPTELQWMPTGPEHAVTVTADLRQRPPHRATPGCPR